MMAEAFVRGDGKGDGDPVRRPGLRKLFLFAAAVSLAVGGGIAVFHVGVEQHWWGGLEGCSGAVTPEQIRDELLRGIRGETLGRCDEIPWTLFGLSMAAYNAALSFGLALLALSATLFKSDPQ